MRPTPIAWPSWRRSARSCSLRSTTWTASTTPATSTTRLRELRDGYTARVATVLRELESARTARRSGEAARRWGRVAAIAGGLAVVAVAAGVLVASVSGERLPGGPAGGDIAENPSRRSWPRPARCRTPTSQGAIQRYDDVLKVEPDNAEALTYRGWLVAPRGLGRQAPRTSCDRGEQSLDRAMQVAPSYADPFCFKAIIEFRYRGDAAGGQAAGRRVPRPNPPQVVLGLGARG